MLLLLSGGAGIVPRGTVIVPTPAGLVAFDDDDEAAIALILAYATR